MNNETQAEKLHVLKTRNDENSANRKSGTELTTMAFGYINSFKRHRALAESCRNEGDTSKAIYHELKQYKEIDGLELALRAIQKELRERH